MIQVTFYRTHLNPSDRHIVGDAIAVAFYRLCCDFVGTPRAYSVSGGGPALHLSHIAINTRYPKYGITNGKHKIITKFPTRASFIPPKFEIMKHMPLSRRRNMLRSGRYVVLASVSSVALISLSLSLFLRRQAMLRRPYGSLVMILSGS